MKKKNWYRALSLADDKYISEAHPDNVIRPKRKRIFIPLAATCACLTLIFCNLWLFIPFDTTPPDVSQYKNSEYYGLIKQLNLLTYQKPKYKNNAEKLWAGLESLYHSLDSFNAKNEIMDEPTGAHPEADNNSDSYQEITDNQVEGIIEADRIKRSDKYIYYLDNEVLRIYSIDKEDTVQVGSYNIGVIYRDSMNYPSDEWEFYLSSDCKTVTIVTQSFQKISNSSDRYVDLISLDVSDPSNIVKRGEFSITGKYMSSRMTNGYILLLTEFAFNKNELDFDDETTYLPQINEGEGFRSIPADGIVTPDELTDTRYTVVLKLDEGTLELKGTAAYLSYSEKVYVSENHVFLTRVFADKKKNDDGSLTRNAMTEISCLAYGGDSFEIKGSATVRGYVKDQWSMDEYENVLRVVTTTNATMVSNRTYGNGSVSSDVLQTATGSSNASLYCIDLNTFETVASVIDFAPWYEEVQSVRFDKESAYVCTSIERSDPVFFFDLSDLNNITYKDTGTIEGYSTSLINLGNGYLLGIGVGGNWNSLKIEVYEETADGVRSVSSYELDDTEYSTEYKSYYVDRKNQLIGLGIVESYNVEGHRYILLHFDGYDLIELVNVPLDGSPEQMRGVYIDGYMYMFGFNDFKVEKVFN